MGPHENADTPDAAGYASPRSGAQLVTALPIPPEAKPGAEFGWILLPRHGKRPLSFRGRNMLHVGDRHTALRDGRPSWSTLWIYERQDDGFVTSLRHADTRNDSIVWQDAWASCDALAVIASLYGHDLAGALLPVTGGALEVAHTGWTALLGSVFGARKIH
jgi:hypothetical protein